MLKGIALIAEQNQKAWEINMEKIKARRVDIESGRMDFDNFTVVKRSDYYFSVLDAFGQEVTSGKSFDNAAKKAKLLQIGFNMGKDRYMNWL